MESVTAQAMGFRSAEGEGDGQVLSARGGIRDGVGAQFNLGICYSTNGVGAAKDAVEAVRYFRLEAAQGDVQRPVCP